MSVGPPTSQGDEVMRLTPGRISATAHTTPVPGYEGHALSRGLASRLLIPTHRIFPSVGQPNGGCGAPVNLGLIGTY